MSLDQAFVKNPDLSVKKHLKQAGSGLEIIDFVKFRLGEGIEVKKANLAEEVASQVANSSKANILSHSYKTPVLR